MKCTKRTTITCLLLVNLAMACIAQRAEAQPSSSSVWAFIGTYTRGESEGIYVAPFDTESGRFGELRLASAAENPSFLAIHPNGDTLYAVGETGNFQGRQTGSVRAYRIDRESGALQPLNSQSSGGAGPCHLVVDSTGNTLLVANYGGGNVASIGLEDDGNLGTIISNQQHVGSSVNPQRQQEPHAHSINLDAANRFAFAADLGLDKILVYQFDAATGRLERPDPPRDADVPPGSGPRHFAFHPSGKFAFVINELASTVTLFRYDAQTGRLEAVQNISTLPENNDTPNSTAEIVVHPEGRLVYGSNRGHDSIAVFEFDAEAGRLTRVQVESTQGSTPRNFVLDPTGKFLLAENQSSNTIVVFKIDPESGHLNATGEVLTVPNPVCVRFQ